MKPEPKGPWTLFRHIPKKVHQYWRNVFSSTERRMTRGSSNISKIISRARNENWRRGREKKK